MNSVEQPSEDRRFMAGDKEVLLSKEPRFGHWKIHLEHGQVPNQLKGDYMTIQDAQRAAVSYYNAEKSRWVRRESPKAKAKINEVRKEMGLGEV